VSITVPTPAACHSFWLSVFRGRLRLSGGHWRREGVSKAGALPGCATPRSVPKLLRPNDFHLRSAVLPDPAGPELCQMCSTGYGAGQASQLRALRPATEQTRGPPLRAVKMAAGDSGNNPGRTMPRNGRTMPRKRKPAGARLCGPACVRERCFTRRWTQRNDQVIAARVDRGVQPVHQIHQVEGGRSGPAPRGRRYRPVRGSR
jgi:hypothetical protein